MSRSWAARPRATSLSRPCRAIATRTLVRRTERAGTQPGPQRIVLRCARAFLRKNMLYASAGKWAMYGKEVYVADVTSAQVSTSNWH